MTSYVGFGGSRRAGFGCGTLVLTLSCHVVGVCVFEVGPMFLRFSGVCRGWLFGDNRLILPQTEGN